MQSNAGVVSINSAFPFDIGRQIRAYRVISYTFIAATKRFVLLYAPLYASFNSTRIDSFIRYFMVITWHCIGP